MSFDIYLWPCTLTPNCNSQFRLWILQKKEWKFWLHLEVLRRSLCINYIIDGVIFCSLQIVVRNCTKMCWWQFSIMLKYENNLPNLCYKLLSCNCSLDRRYHILFTFTGRTTSQPFVNFISLCVIYLKTWVLIML